MSKIKQQLSLAAGLMIASLMVLSWPLTSCANYSQPLPGPAPVATATPYAVSVGAAGSTFSPNAISVPSGTVVAFTMTNTHTIHIDDGTGSGTCSATNYNASANHTFSGTSGKVYRIHCDYHSCGATCPLGCTGMVMTVTLL